MEERIKYIIDCIDNMCMGHEDDPGLLAYAMQAKDELMKVEQDSGEQEVQGPYDIITHLHRQRDFSERAFGPGTRTAGVIDHIRKELQEIEAAPGDLTEWIDVVLLALDGAWRSGHSPEQIARALESKQATNERRDWPDWTTADPDKAIEHNREQEVQGEAIRDVIAERRRQIVKEGYTAEHDSKHDDGELIWGAAAYAVEAAGGDGERLWPWGAMDWMPKGCRQNLVRAAALIVAQIDRIDRTTKQGEG